MVTSFRHNPFQRARIKLAAFFTTGVLALVIVFSISVYILFSRNAADNLEYQGTGSDQEASVETQIVTNEQHRLQIILLIMDGLVVFLAGGVSYFVAGKALQPAEAAYAAQKKFVADAAHELRTPLAIMKTGAETVLAGDGSSEEYRRYIIDSLGESEFLTGVINDLLFLARGSNSVPAVYPLDLGELVQKQVRLMAPYASARSISLSCQTAEGLIINGNPDHLRRLLGNLIKNAIDYNRAHGWVKVSLHRAKGSIVLQVADSGAGISAHDLTRVFDRFYKADAARSDTGGAGLGLSIAKEIVTAHRGKMDISSNQDEGTQVTVRLPAA